MPRVAVRCQRPGYRPLPPQPVLQALLERLREGLLLFTEDGRLRWPIQPRRTCWRAVMVVPPLSGFASCCPLRWNTRASMVTGTAACRWARGHAHLYHHGWWTGALPGLVPSYRRTGRLRARTAAAPRRAAPGLPAAQRHPGETAAIGEDGLDRPASRRRAHEINNPIGYVHSNLGSLQGYLRSLFTVIEAYERALRAPDPKALIPEIDDIRDRLDTISSAATAAADGRIARGSIERGRASCVI